jgi:hypothetical protein
MFVPMRAYMALPLLLAPLLYGCSDATGSLVGGDSLAAMTAPSDASTPSGEGGGGGATNQTNPDCIPGGSGAHAGNSWTDLYTCYFGTSGTDSCAGSVGNCHGTGTDPGGSIWACGMTSDSCYKGMTGYIGLQVTTSKSDPTMAHLYQVICSQGGPGYMPLFCPPGTSVGSADLDRIAAWVGAGAPEN